MRQSIHKYYIEGQVNSKRIEGDATLHYWRAQHNIPNTWKKVGIISREIPQWSYESGLIDVYINREGVYKFSIYHSGNFYPYMGTIELPLSKG